MTSLKKLLIATNNQGKLKEISSLLSPYDIEIITTKNYDFPEPEETGNTFAENAHIKSLYYNQKTNLTSLADDSGLCIPAIDNQPGIFSARWAGPNKDFSVAIKKIEKTLQEKNIPLKDNKIDAYFVCALSLAFTNQEPQLFIGKVEGHLTFPARGSHGFGYDPIFIPKNYNKTFAEMLPKEKEPISHRFNAFKKLKNFINKNVA